RSLHDATDIAAVLHHRIEACLATQPQSPARNLIAGLIPRAQRVEDEDFAQALDEREHAIEKRAATVLDHAIRSRAAWLKALGPPPKARNRRVSCLLPARTIAAYRDHWNITTPQPLGPPGSPRTTEQKTQEQHAAGAAHRALRIARQSAQQQAHT